MPDDIPEYTVKDDEKILDIIVGQKMAGSRSEARRIIDQQGVKLDGEVMSDLNVEIPDDAILQVGKRRF